MILLYKVLLFIFIAGIFPIIIITLDWYIYLKNTLPHYQFSQIRGIFSKNMLNTFALTILFLLLISLFLSVHITSPIKRISENIKKYLRGNKNIYIDIKSKDEIGELAKSFNRMVDIINRRNEKLRTLYKDLSAIYERAPLAIYRTSVDGRIIYVNKKFLELFGYDKKELRKECAEILWFSKEDRKKFIKELKNKGEVHKEVLLKRKDGSPIYAKVHARLIKKGDEELIEGIIEDVSLAKEYEKIKTLFTDVVFHDIVNITFVTKYLLEDYLRDKDEEYLKRAIKNIKRIQEIIKSFDMLLRLKDRVSLDLVEISLTDEIRHSIEENIYDAKAKNIDIIFDCNEDIKIKAHKSIREVFTNLISNAIKYSPRNSKIEIEVKKMDNIVRISVRDYGIGIPDKYKQKIFERFERIKKEGIKGSGLGLAIVKRIVELHNGKVWVEDNKPKGSIFIVELPINK